MNQCKTCKEYKTDKEFPWRNKAKEIKNYYMCKICKRLYGKKLFNSLSKEERDKKYKKNRENLKNRKNIISKLYCEYLLKHPCADCGETNLLVLEPDHLKDKERSITSMIKCGLTWNKILHELSKCEIVCANCHRIRTYTRMTNNYRIDFLKNYN